MHFPHDNQGPEHQVPQRMIVAWVQQMETSVNWQIGAASFQK
jgi:hypothetical protein